MLLVLKSDTILCLSTIKCLNFGCYRTNLNSDDKLHFLSFSMPYIFYSLWQSNTRSSKPPLMNTASYLLDLIRFRYLSSHILLPVIHSPILKIKVEFHTKSMYMNCNTLQQNGILYVREVCLNATSLANFQATHLKESYLLEMYSVKRTPKITPGMKPSQIHLLTAVLKTLFKHFKQLKWL